PLACLRERRFHPLQTQANVSNAYEPAPSQRIRPKAGQTSWRGCESATSAARQAHRSRRPARTRCITTRKRGQIVAKQRRQRARRDERAANPPPIHLTERDQAVIKAVYEYRVLTTQQLKTLFFPSLHQAYARLAALYHHGFLARQFTGVYADKMNTPILYTLDRRGAELLRAE